MIKRIGIFFENETSPSLVWWADPSLTDAEAVADAKANIPTLLLELHQLTDARAL